MTSRARVALALIAAAIVALPGCRPRPDKGAVVVSVIGDAPRLRDPARTTAAEPDRVVAGATAQGLVSFDAAGDIQQGLAQRWIVIDGGRTYIFRLRRAAWSDGRPVTAREIVAWLKHQIARGSRNPLLPYLSAIDDVVAMTPDVIEVDLSHPRPDLLALFAQPELAVLRAPEAIGAGPFRIVVDARAAPLLTPVPDLDRATDEQHEATPEDNVRLRGERAALAIARFVARESDLVAGGTVADWPILQAATPAPANIRLDLAAGLFGLAVVARRGLLATPAGRIAVAEAIDRAALTTAFAREWAPTEQLLPAQLDSASAPAAADWVSAPLADRRAEARAVVAAWRDANGGDPPTLRLALPAGPGGTRLWSLLAADLIAIGVRPVRVAADAPADLRLIDAVAPYDSARWYLATACADCGLASPKAIEDARLAPTLGSRAAAIAAADRVMADDGGYIPIARPFRWSLVSVRAARLATQRARCPPVERASFRSHFDPMTDRASRFDTAAVLESLPLARDPAAVRQRIEVMERLLEGLFVIPGINRRVGLDAILGLVPVFGDIAAAGLGAWLVWEARNLGMGRWQLARMGGRVAFDALLGAVPLVGDVADFFYRSNSANLKTIKRHLDRHHPATVTVDR